MAELKTPIEIAEEATAAWWNRPGSNQPQIVDLLVGGRSSEGTKALHALMAEAILADRAQQPKPIVALRQGEVTEGHAEVIDLNFLDGNEYGAYDRDDIEAMVALLRANELDSAADDVREWWDGRDPIELARKQLAAALREAELAPLPDFAALGKIERAGRALLKALGDADAQG